jgi:rod shape-determining protein MreD
MNWSDLILLPLIVVLLIIQLTVLPLIPLLSVVPQLPLVLVLAWALVQDRLESTAVWAFVAGVFMDLYSIAPLGSTALVLVVVVTVLTYLKRGLPGEGLLAPALLGGIGTFLAILLNYTVLQLTGFDVSFNVATASAPLILIHGILVVPAYAGLLWWRRRHMPGAVEF